MATADSVLQAVAEAVVSLGKTAGAGQGGRRTWRRAWCPTLSEQCVFSGWATDTGPCSLPSPRAPPSAPPHPTRVVRRQVIHHRVVLDHRGQAHARLQAGGGSRDEGPHAPALGGGLGRSGREAPRRVKRRGAGLECQRVQAGARAAELSPREAVAASGGGGVGGGRPVCNSRVCRAQAGALLGRQQQPEAPGRPHELGFAKRLPPQLPELCRPAGCSPWTCVCRAAGQKAAGCAVQRTRPPPAGGDRTASAAALPLRRPWSRMQANLHWVAEECYTEAAGMPAELKKETPRGGATAAAGRCAAQTAR